MQSQILHCNTFTAKAITTKNIPAGINKRLSSLSSDKASFDQAAPPYQKALNESGYHYTLQYEPAKASKRKNLQRNIIWYNPPFTKNASTNIGHKFLALVDKHFPKDHKLRKIFNRNTIKISYSCMNNTKQIIDNHNKHILTAPMQIDNTATAAAAIPIPIYTSLYFYVLSTVLRTSSSTLYIYISGMSPCYFAIAHAH